MVARTPEQFVVAAVSLYVIDDGCDYEARAVFCEGICAYRIGRQEGDAVLLPLTAVELVPRASLIATVMLWLVVSTASVGHQRLASGLHARLKGGDRHQDIPVSLMWRIIASSGNQHSRSLDGPPFTTQGRDPAVHRRSRQCASYAVLTVASRSTVGVGTTRRFARNFRRLRFGLGFTQTRRSIIGFI